MKRVERFDVSPVEQELSARIWFERNQVEQILLDGDDSLWQIVPIFRQQMGLCYKLLAQTGIKTEDLWKQEIAKINDRLFESHGVNPDRWSQVIDSLAQFGLTSEVMYAAKEILNQIYWIPPKFINGTEAGLRFLNKIGIPFGIVTHANREWTWRKWNWLNLQRFMKWDDIYIVDENGHKREKEWKEGMDYFGVRPERCMVGGDSPRSDINPVIGLGVRRCFMISNDYGIWSIHQQEVDEEKTRLISSIGDLQWLGREVVFADNYQRR